MDLVVGVLIPFIGTALGSACVLFVKNRINLLVQKGLIGFASGVMTAAAVWSLLIPAIDMSRHMGKLSIVPAAVGFGVGISFLLLMDRLIPHLHIDSITPEGMHSTLKNSTLFILAVTLHNLPEGMAVGVIFAGLRNGDGAITAAGALALSIGIAIQNFPEGAIISLPLRSEGLSRGKAFLYGTLTGIVEPAGALITILFAGVMVAVLPYMLSFAAGSMLYVVVEELIPEASEGEHSNIGTVGFAAGFLVMMSLDVMPG